MKTSAIKGFCFGLTSAIITTLGMIMGLSSLNSRIVLIGGIVSIAVADSVSDALGIHISEESSKRNSTKSIWTATLSTFLSKLVFSSSFIIPFLLFNITNAIKISIIYGIVLLTILSYFLAKERKEKPLSVIGEHVGIAIFVIALTYYVGKWIAIVFA